MKAQISRLTHEPGNRYGVVMLQQGRMVTDADWNESVQRGRDHTVESLGDTVRSGIPQEGGAVRVAPDGSASLAWGIAYVDGIRAVVTPRQQGPAAFQLGNQADLLVAQGAALVEGQTVYLDVWDRVVTSVEEARLADPAWRGADTAFRTQVMAQVKQSPAGRNPADPDVNPAAGNARLKAQLGDTIESADPCDPCAEDIAVPAAIGNSLFRLEVHAVDDPANPHAVTLKWSSENGAEQNPAVTPMPAWFTSGDHWFEFFNRQTEQRMGVFLAPPAAWQLASLELVNNATPLQAQAGSGAFTGVRRWDGWCRLERQGNGPWTVARANERSVVLGQGNDRARVVNGELQLSLTDLQLGLKLSGPGDVPLKALRGDYWLVEIRGGLEAPAAGAADPRCVVLSATPSGIRHHYLVLGTWQGGQLVVGDDPRGRALSFPPLTNLNAGHVSYDPTCETGLYPKGTATVQSALDAICNLDAGQVRYETTCQTLEKAGTVGNALDILCASLGTRVDDCAPRLALFGRGVLCGLRPSAALRKDARGSVVDAVLDIVRAQPERPVLEDAEFADRVRLGVEPEPPRPSDTRMSLISALKGAGDRLGDPEVRKEIYKIQPELAEDALDARLQAVVDGLTLAAPGRREKVAVTFTASPGTVVDGKGCYHDVGELRLTEMVASWRVELGIRETDYAKLATNVRALADAPAVAHLSTATVEKDVSSRAEAIVAAVAGSSASSEIDLRNAVAEVGPWRSTVARDRVADLVVEQASSQRRPVAVFGWLFIVFDDAGGRLEFRDRPPGTWIYPPAFLRPVDPQITASPRDLHDYVRTMLDAVALEVPQTGDVRPRPEEVVAMATDDRGLVTLGSVRAALSNAFVSTDPQMPVSRSDVTASVDRLLTASMPASVSRAPLMTTFAAPLSFTSNAATASAAILAAPFSAPTSPAASASLMKAAPAASAAAMPFGPSLNVKPVGAAEPHGIEPALEVSATLKPATGLGAGSVIGSDVGVKPGLPPGVVLGPPQVIPEITLPEFPPIFQPHPGEVVIGEPQDANLDDQMNAAWAPFEDVGCPQPNDGSVCLGRVGVFGDTVIVVPDDREQLVETPANRNAVYWATHRNAAFDAIWQQVTRNA
jgi:hypothetical protein